MTLQFTAFVLSAFGSSTVKWEHQSDWPPRVALGTQHILEAVKRFVPGALSAFTKFRVLSLPRCGFQVHLLWSPSIKSVAPVSYTHNKVGPYLEKQVFLEV